MQPTDRHRPVATLAALVAAGGLALVIAGCSGAAPAEPLKTSGAAHVTITMNNDGSGDACVADHDLVPAGPITFTVTNESATGITEVELMSQERILGEKENLAPGLAPVSFTVTLGGGKYQIYCPGAEKETTTFTVTGRAAPRPTGSIQSLLASGATEYAGYVDDQITGMVRGVAAVKSAVDAGDLNAAKKAYAQARPFYERIETDVDGFALPGFSATDNAGSLDYLLDMRQSNLDEAVGWHGFHAVERDLFGSGAITASTKKLTTELQTNVGKLATLAAKLTYKPEDLANGAAGLLEEVQSGKIQGEEEAYSHTDLVDIAANVEGAQQAFAFLKPGLTKIDAGLTAEIATQFTTVDTMLDTYRETAALGGYRTYTAQLRASDANRLSQTIQGLQDPLSRIAEKVATAQ
jgi:Predicted periplasmic lipoprotein involved in iron transport